MLPPWAVLAHVDRAAGLAYLEGRPDQLQHPPAARASRPACGVIPRREQRTPHVHTVTVQSALTYVVGALRPLPPALVQPSTSQLVYLHPMARRPQPLDPAAVDLDEACLDWRHAKLSSRRRTCVSCFGPTFLIDPDTGKPCHKTCAERELTAARRQAARSYARS